MSFNFNDFDDYSSWSWFWKTFTDFLVRLEKIETKESLEKRINQIIIDLDKAVWGAYIPKDVQQTCSHPFMFAKFFFHHLGDDNTMAK